MSRGGCLKKVGLEPPYELWNYNFVSKMHTKTCNAQKNFTLHQESGEVENKRGMNNQKDLVYHEETYF